MKVLVDTPVWSLALRRQRRADTNEAMRSALANLVNDDLVAMIGPIRQELLSGVKEQSQFEQLREHLRAFPETLIEVADYEEAASFYNRCRARGIQGSNTDFLICAVAARNDFAIFTTDADFTHYRRLLPIVLYQP